MANFNLNDYETVADRIRRFKGDWPDSVILTELVEHVGNIGGTRWVMKASIWRERGHDTPDATGWAFEVDGAGMANKTSALENCETSAIGRALANLNYHGDLRATREEMEKVRRAEEHQKAEEQARRMWLQQQADKLLEAERAGDVDVVERVRDWASQRNDADLAGMARSTLDRMRQATPTADEAVETVQEVLDAEPVND